MEESRASSLPVGAAGAAGAAAAPRAAGGEARPETPRERRRRRTREDLVAATLQVIGEFGDADLTIDRVSAASGISRGTIYAHFPDGRDELLSGAYAELARDLIARTSSAAALATDWRDSIVAHAEAMLELAGDARIGHFFNVSGPALIVDGAARGIGSGASALMIRDELAAASAAGLIDPGLDAASTARLLVGAIRESAIAVVRDGADPAASLAAFGRLVAGLERREPPRAIRMPPEALRDAATAP
ncbi:TetR/AcrR family transcriptional regulator [Leucobacter sp. CSA2]|uniref:TetR/AcrR family transcriptional regulator n=1 Tax=Leucobacter edaphi TaxID=2796472 RepID=A0A934QEH8_9MICO|nr:TetR/AcrR family transcriptional regulator [Leucobacter edaphi]MBK0422491.1 TetR/AcrR family transcriptional regulator [Leucobacter edaphi]